MIPAPGRGALVELDNVSRAFAATGPVLSPLNLKIEPGEFVSLLGPSGCGKSTLLRLIAGLDQPSDGSVTTESHGRRFFRGFVFQESHLLPWRTALANAALPLELTDGKKTSEAEQKAREALLKVGLADALEKYPSQLSGGMKMRVSVARALATEPSLLLLDEPFSALDESTRHRLQEDLCALWEKLRMTVVFVTHSVSEAVFLSDRTIVFSTRPARVSLDRKIALPSGKGERSRSSPAFLKEVEAIDAAFPRHEGHT